MFMIRGYTTGYGALFAFPLAPEPDSYRDNFSRRFMDSLSPVLTDEVVITEYHEDIFSNSYLR